MAIGHNSTNVNNRLLWLHVATAIPSENLVELFTYVKTVYATLWFHIKTRTSY